MMLLETGMKEEVMRWLPYSVRVVSMSNNSYCSSIFKNLMWFEENVELMKFMKLILCESNK